MSTFKFMLINAYIVFVTEFIEFKDYYIILYITVEWIFLSRG